MKSFRFNLSKAFLAITLLAIPLAVYGTVEFNRRREEMLHAQLQQDEGSLPPRIQNNSMGFRIVRTVK